MPETTKAPTQNPNDNHHKSSMVKITDIKIIDRYRIDPGDLEPLAASINELGLLHPPVVDLDLKLICGYRRIHACKLLGWTEIPVRIMDIRSPLRAEHDENALRKSFLPSEMVAITEAIRKDLEVEARQRQLKGLKNVGSSGKIMPHEDNSASGRVNDTLAIIAGVSRMTLEKAISIVNAAAENQDYVCLVEEMDANGRIDAAYKKLKQMRLCEQLELASVSGSEVSTEMRLYNEDCISGAKKHVADESVDLMICDPPFGIGENSLGPVYNRDFGNILPGYAEAPVDYYAWTQEWMAEAYRVLKPNGSMYFITGWNWLEDVLCASRLTGFRTINHLIWKYDFGLYTQRKYVSSHYHILYLAKQDGQPKFNNYCRYKPDAKDVNGGSMLYQDLEDVFNIPRENQKSQVKNANKLPKELVRKLIQYSSDPGDVVADFFMGNFTTAYCAFELGRNVVGFEINPAAYSYHVPILQGLVAGNA